ncbi:MAG: tetratricopeptide repeat protein [Gemmatimonadales bacterium]
MAITEIEKLERRFAENPQGFSFAPLAEAYRKSGDPERAIGILRPGLELHPDYIPASIVLGRCQLDLGRDADAEAAFTHVVALDAENVIALKALADLGERASRYADAAGWLRQLIEVDRSNEEAQAQLGRVLAAEQQFDAATRERAADDAPFTVEGNAAGFAPAEELVEEPILETHAELEPEPEPVEAPEPAVEPASFVADASSESFFADLPTSVDVSATSEADSILDPVMPDEAAPREDLAVQQLGGGDEIVLEGRDQSEFQLPSVSDHLGTDDVGPATRSLASEYQLPDASADLVFDSPTTPSEFQVPDASSSLLADVAADSTTEAAGEFESFAAYAMPTADVPPLEVSEVVPAADDDDAPVGEWTTWSDAALDEDALPFEDPAPAPQPVMEEPPVVERVATPEPAVQRDVEADLEPDLVVTESMAELFVRQGHAGDALRIYRELAGRRPGDVRLVARIAELETVESATRVPSTPYAARVSGGTSVRDVMRSILAARPGERGPAPAASMPASDAGARPAEPTRPAQDSISLSDVFGDEGAASPPAYRTPRAPAADKGVSFDEFFDAPAEPHTSGVRPRGPRPPADDLDQFHSWLQNLKR